MDVRTMGNGPRNDPSNTNPKPNLGVSSCFTFWNFHQCIFPEGHEQQHEFCCVDPNVHK